MLQWPASECLERIYLNLDFRRGDTRRYRGTSRLSGIARLLNVTNTYKYKLIVEALAAASFVHLSCLFLEAGALLAASRPRHRCRPDSANLLVQVFATFNMFANMTAEL